MKLEVTDNLRWLAAPARLMTGPTLPGEERILLVSVTDVLAALDSDRADVVADLASTLELILSVAAERSG